MRKSFMNIKHFVESKVHHQVDRTTNGASDPINDDLVIVERQFEDLRQLCLDAEKRISTLLQSIGSSTLGAYTQNVQANLSNLSQLTHVTSTVQAASTSTDQQNSTLKNHVNSSSLCNNVRTHGTSNNQSHPDGSQLVDDAEVDIRKHHRKLPIVGFLKFLVKTCHKLRQDSLMATTLTHCSHLQAQLTKLYMSYERTIEVQCLKPIQQVLETEVPNVIKLRKSFIKAHNDLESVKARYNGASQKQQQQQQLTSQCTSTSYTITQSNAQQASINKLDLLKKELDDAETRFEQAKDIYAIELYTFVCRETEFVELFMKFYQHQAEYQAQASTLIQHSLPSLSNTLATTPRRVVFGTPLEEHLRCTGRSVSVLVELCVHLLYSNALNEEGLFRIPGSSIKIRKLKSAINAWFVTLATHNELLENQDHQRQLKTMAATQQPTLLAVYSLFKDIVGHRPQHQAGTTPSGQANQNNQIAPTSREDLTNACADYSAPDRDLRKLVFDVHTVAGLLKLYLRELPESLLGDALYDQWVDACVKSSDTGEQEPTVGLMRVVEQLPKANYDNLRLLIRFLHLLTCHHEKNKMTATNLAITMAPSLIWINRNRQHQLNTGTGASTDNNHQTDETQALNMQMCNIGISASLHALIVENLINHAERLFPGDIDFAVANLDVEPVLSIPYGRRMRSLIQERPVKSTSPTGSSTESTSSFSSNSNISGSKKSGSVEGLTPSNSDNASPLPVRPTRPLSVHINQLEPDKRPLVPNVPPAPANRSHTRQASDSINSVRRLASRKPPAPPVPVAQTPRETPQATTAGPTRSSECDDGRMNKSPDHIDELLLRSALATAQQPTSLRGTGTVTCAKTTGTASTRPSVPPPGRPFDQSEKGQHDVYTRFVDLTNGNVGGLRGVLRSSKSELDNINGLDMIDDIDISEQISTVVSLDSVSGDDSSFDNQSLDQSWTECDTDKDTKNKQIDSSGDETALRTRPNDRIDPTSINLVTAEDKNNLAKETQSEIEIGQPSLAKTESASQSTQLVPTKPPRNNSPNTNALGFTQSTLL